MNILFVCLGNICRSPMAECVMDSIIDKNNTKGVTVDSAGLIGYHTGEEPDSRMRSAARKKGYTMRHRARDRKSTRLNSSHIATSRMPSSA